MQVHFILDKNGCVEFYYRNQCQINVFEKLLIELQYTECFYESEIVKRRDQRQFSQIVLAQVASRILLWTNEALSRKQFVIKFLHSHFSLWLAFPRSSWQLREAWKGSPSTSFYPCRSQT